MRSSIARSRSASSTSSRRSRRSCRSASSPGSSACPSRTRTTLIGWGDRMIMNTDPDYADVLYDSPESEAYRLVPFRQPGRARALRVRPRDRGRAARRAARRPRLEARPHRDRRRAADRAGVRHDVPACSSSPGTRRRGRRSPTGCRRSSRTPTSARGCATISELAWQTGADEILRWSSPVLHFRRTATVDTEIRGQPIAAGRQGRRLVRLGELRRGGLRRARALRRRAGRRTGTSRSAAAGRTTASARTWRSSRCRSSSTSSSRGSATSS